MNEIGLNIKSLRLSKGMTQEQLAGEIGVSSQAVSKWENGITLPDIQLLPELSVSFGVTIDSLFSLSDEARFERIDNMIWAVRYISENDFQQAERFLKEKYSNEASRPQAGLLLAELYNKRADEYHSLAAPLAKRALLDNPDCKEAHNAIFDSDGGVVSDWNIDNHHVLIDWYKGFIDAHPENRRTYLWLLDLLLADGRCEEAADYLERMKAIEHTYHYELYRGHLLRAQYRIDEAMAQYDEMLALYPDNWVVWESYADVMARLCRYDEAIEAYKKAMPLRDDPPFIDCEEALSHLYELKGDYEAAVEMQEKIIELMKTHWGETEGEGIDFRLREIERLKHKSKEQSV